MRQFAFDKLNRPTQETWLSGGAVVKTFNYTLDEASQWKGASDGTTTPAFGYDFHENLTSSTTSGNGLSSAVVLSAGFDVAGNRTSLSAQIGATKNFVNADAYDRLYRLTQVTQTSQSGGDAVSAKRVNLTYQQDGQTDYNYRYRDLAGTLSVATDWFWYDGVGRNWMIVQQNNPNGNPDINRHI